jgi:hypothetical protein
MNTKKKKKKKKKKKNGLKKARVRAWSSGP